jgi:hypothetical protein
MASIIRFQHHCYLSSHDSRSHTIRVVALLVLLERTQMIGILKALELLIVDSKNIFIQFFTLFAEDYFGKSNWYFIIVSSAAIWNNSTSARELLCQSSTSIVWIHPC